jgi:two-component system phosphate regulon response regulator PhoB
MRELALRVRRLVPGDGPAKPAPGASLQFGSLRIDPPAHRAWVSGSEITLTALEFRLLVTLCQRRERVQTREALLEELWGHDARVLVRTVDAYVKRLRHKLGEAGRYIDTVRGVGYRFTRERPTPPG